MLRVIKIYEEGAQTHRHPDAISCCPKSQSRLWSMPFSLYRRRTVLDGNDAVLTQNFDAFQPMVESLVGSSAFPQAAPDPDPATPPRLPGHPHRRCVVIGRRRRRNRVFRTHTRVDENVFFLLVSDSLEDKKRSRWNLNHKNKCAFPFLSFLRVRVPPFPMFCSVHWLFE